MIVLRHPQNAAPPSYTLRHGSSRHPAVRSALTGMATTTAGRVIDKRGKLAAIASSSTVELEIGCGSIRRRPQAIGIDRRDAEGVDVVGDVFDVLGGLPDASVDAVYSSHFVAHLD